MAKVSFLTAKTLLDLELPHCFSCAPKNYSYVHGDTATVDFNRQELQKSLGLDYLAIPNEIHSAEVAVVNEYASQGLSDLKVDALVTKLPGQGVGILTADCGPVLMADKQAGVVAAAHAGWRGALAGILENTLDAMESLGADRQRIVSVIGPTIAMSSYEVGPEFAGPFLEHKECASRFFGVSDTTLPGHQQFDLPGYIAWRLEEAGVTKVEDLALDTYTDPDLFFSHRYRKKHTGFSKGNMLAAIGIL